LIIAFAATLQVCAANADGTPEDETVVDWNSRKLREIQTEWQSLQAAYEKDTWGKPSKSKYSELVAAVDRLFMKRLSKEDLRSLAASSEMVAVLDKDRNHFVTDLLAFMVKAFVGFGDRESLVILLSKRCPSRIAWPEDIEYYLAHRARRLTDPILVLGEAYSRCQVPETRHTLAAAVRRGFAGLGIRGNDDADYVKNAMQWYERQKNELAVNVRYPLNESGGVMLFTIEVYGEHPEFYEQPPAGAVREPLFKKRTASSEGPNPGGLAVLVIWLVHTAIALSLSAPILFFGRKRVHWHSWELLAVILPFAVWAILFASPLSVGRKSLVNLVEAVFLSIGVPMAALVRLGISSWLSERVCAGVLIALLCVVAVAIFFAVPPFLDVQ
jgi:hypothetical protein